MPAPRIALWKSLTFVASSLAAFPAGCGDDGARGGAAHALSFRVSTFNLRNDEDWWEDRGVIIRAGLAAEAPDVVGLQEVVIREMNLERMIADIRDLDPSLAYNAESTLPPEPFGSLTGEGMASLSRFTIDESDVLYLSEGRTASFVRLNMGGGHRLDHYNTHLHAGGGEDGAAIREAQAADLIAFMDEHGAGWPTVLTGDFNATPEEAAVGLFLGAGFTDSYAELNGDAPEVEGFTSPVVLAREPVAAGAKRRIDYILYHPGTEEHLVSARVSRVTFNEPAEDGLFASDHFGVTTDFDVVFP